MSTQVEAHGLVYDHPGKGHDRLYLDRDQNFFAVLDGAGGPELSQAIVARLPEAVSRHSPLRRTSQTAFLAHVVAEADGLVEGFLYRKSTGAFVCLQPQADQMVATYVNLGDSWLHFYDAATSTLRPLAHTPTTYVHDQGQAYIDTRHFLGFGRDPAEVVGLVHELVLPLTAAWSLVGWTDGVQDDDGRGITPATLIGILTTAAAADVPTRILSSIDKYDDAGLFIIRYQ